LKGIRFILSHHFRVFSPWSLGFIASGHGQAEHHGGRPQARKLTHLTHGGLKQRKKLRERDREQYISFNFLPQ
jgi:hypothetical protein